jgi:hypothetical protein
MTTRPQPRPPPLPRRFNPLFPTILRPSARSKGRFEFAAALPQPPSTLPPTSPATSSNPSGRQAISPTRPRFPLAPSAMPTFVQLAAATRTTPALHPPRPSRADPTSRRTRVQRPRKLPQAAPSSAPLRRIARAAPATSSSSGFAQYAWCALQHQNLRPPRRGTPIAAIS